MIDRYNFIGNETLLAMMVVTFLTNARNRTKYQVREDMNRPSVLPILRVHREKINGGR